MRRLITNEAQARVAKWILKAKPTQVQEAWTEHRLAVDFGGKIVLLSTDQIFQCAHCGHYDMPVTQADLIEFFKGMGIVPFEVEIICTVARTQPDEV